MSSKPKIRITLVEKRGTKGCSRGHRIGDSWDYDTERGDLCPMAMHTAFVICRYPALRRLYFAFSGRRRTFCLPRSRCFEYFQNRNCKDG